MALGSDDGTVEIFTNWKIDCTLKSFQKLIQSLAWHPTDPHSLAAASNEFEIHLWTLDEEKMGGNNPIHTRPDQVLAGHKLRVIQLTWSPYDVTKLLSVSYDGTAQVWDVPSESGIGNVQLFANFIFSFCTLVGASKLFVYKQSSLCSFSQKI